MQIVYEHECKWSGNYTKSNTISHDKAQGVIFFEHVKIAFPRPHVHFLDFTLVEGLVQYKSHFWFKVVSSNYPAFFFDLSD